MSTDNTEAIRRARAWVREKVGTAVVRQHGAEVLGTDTAVGGQTVARVRLAVIVEVDVPMTPTDELLTRRRAREVQRIREKLADDVRRASADQWGQGR